MGCRIQLCSRKFQIFKIRAHLWRCRWSIYAQNTPKINQMLITSLLSGWNFAFRLILGCRIPKVSNLQNRGPPVTSRVPFMSNVLITSLLNGIKSWNLAFRLIFGCRIWLCSRKFQIFKIGAHLWHHMVHLRPKYPQN